MVSVNTVIIGGHLGADPEDKRTQSGKLMCKFNVATSRWDTKSQAEATDWHTVVVWEKQAENCLKYLSKGAPVLIEGRLVVNQWEGSDGKKLSKHEISASRVSFLGRKRDGVPRAAEGDDAAGDGRSTRGLGAGFADAIPF